jgi:hypothetical protein
MALDRAHRGATRAWPQKAVIFTESRRTQDALLEALEEPVTGQVLLLQAARATPMRARRSSTASAIGPAS